MITTLTKTLLSFKEFYSSVSVIDFEQVNVPREALSLQYLQYLCPQCHYNTVFKYSKSTTKILGKCVKYVQGRIIQRKMSDGNSMG